MDFLPTTGELMYYGFGTETFDQDTPTTGKNVHTLTTDDKGTLPSGTTTSNATELPSMTLSAILEGGTNDFRRDFVGATVDSLSLSLSESGELSASMDIRAKDVEDEGLSSPTLWSQPTSDAERSDPQPYMFYDRSADIHVGGTFSYSSPTYTSSDLGYSGGRTFANIKSFDLSLNNNIKPHWYTNSSEPKKVQRYTTSNPEFSLSMDIVPDSNLKAQDEDAIYDMLENGTRGDILIPFQRADNDELHIVAEDAWIQAAPHELNEAGEEITVSADTAIEELRIVAIDSSAAYNGL